MNELHARVNAVLDTLPVLFSQNTAAALDHCFSVGIRNPQARHVMGFGCQLGVHEQLTLHFGSRLSSEQSHEQFFDIDAFDDGSVFVDVKCRTLGASQSWTISRREIEAVCPAMIYAFYTYSEKGNTFALFGTMVRANNERTNFVPPRPSTFNEGGFWFQGDVQPGNVWRFT